MKLPLYVVNSFADSTFSGNPAAVVVTDAPLPEGLMQAIAAQNNLSETAFVVRGDELQLRWFSPAVEVDLCGHATLAAAHVLWEHGYSKEEQLGFQTQSGPVSVTKAGNRLQLNFPVRPAHSVEMDRAMVVAALGCALDDVAEILESRSLLIVLSDETQVQRLEPDLRLLGKLHPWAVVVTAPGSEVDFVARFFAPNSGMDEDPVTGSAYTTLAPYWAKRLGKQSFTARQLSARGGNVWCELSDDRVLIAGHVQNYLVGEIKI